jgi:hypothetical protein
MRSFSLSLSLSSSSSSSLSSPTVPSIMNAT